MAGVTGKTGKTLMPGSGLLSAYARAQYAAVAAMRWRMFVNGLHSIHGILDMGATGIAWMFYALIGLGAGFGLGAGAYAMAKQSQWLLLPMLFWIAGVLWLMLPIVVASYQEQADLGILLRFPVSLRSYFTLFVISGLMEASTIVGALCCFGIWLGIVLVRPQMAAPLALVLAIFAIFNILLVRAVFAWVDRWLAQRRSREILGVAFMALILSAQFFNPALHQHRHWEHGAAGRLQQREQVQETVARYAPVLRTAYQVQRWLPAGLAARAVEQSADGKSAQAMAWLGLLSIWALAAGGTLGLRLRTEYRGENLGWAPAPTEPRRTATKGMWTKHTRTRQMSMLGGSGACAAAIEKEVHSLMRTLPFLWALGAPLLLVLVIGGLFHPGASALSFPYALPLCVAYALLGFVPLLYNNLGTEGSGIQLLFLSPTPIRTVLLAKNLLHGGLFILVACAAAALGSLRLGVPPAALLAALGAWLLFSLPVNLAAGNILSLTMPYRINPGRIGRQSGSQSNRLTGILIQAGTLAVGAAVVSLCWSLDTQWLAVPIFLTLAVVAFFVWRRVLSNVDAMALERRDALIVTLMKVQ